MEEYTEKLANFVLNTKFDEIPTQVIELAKKHFLDCVGCALAEAAQPRSKIVLNFLSDVQSNKGDCRIIGTEMSSTVENAAYVTGILSHTICFDDSGPSHPSVTVVPELLAVGEKYGISGKDLLVAQIMGYEVFQRLNAVTKEAWEMRQRGWHPTGFFGAVTCAAETSRLLNLNLDATQRAMAIAATTGGGLSRNIGNMGMGLHAGNACRNGVIAAYLAKEGFLIDKAPLEGRFGLMDALCGPGSYDISVLVSGLSTENLCLQNPGITIKPYPNCWAHHKVLQSVIELVSEYQIKPGMVEKVYVDLQVEKPTYRYLNPENDLEARYSLGYGIAMAIIDGKLTLDQYEANRINSEEVKSLMKRIIHVHQDEIDKQQTVTIELKDGRSLSKRTLYSKGHPIHDPMTLEEEKEKYRICAGKRLPKEKVEQSMEMILNLESVSNIRDVVDLLVL